MFFFAGGTARVTTKDGLKKDFTTIKEAMKYLWANQPPTKPTSPTKPSKSVLAGTEDMPWSGTNYPILWGGKPGDKSLMLNTMEADTMSDLGWELVDTPNGPVYRKGPEQLAFYNHGNAKYWSNFNTGSETQSFPKVEDALRWLWKNKPVKESIFKKYMQKWLE